MIPSNFEKHKNMFESHYITSNTQWTHVDSSSIRRRNYSWKVGREFIDFERQIHGKIVTSIQRGSFDVDSTFKIDEIPMSSPREFFYVVPMSNLHSCCTRCFHSVVFLLWEPILS